MRAQRCIVCLALIAMVAMFFADSAFAARAHRRGRHTSRSHGGRGSYQSAVARAYAARIRAEAVRAAAIRSARAEVARASSEFTRARTKLEAKQMLSPERASIDSDLEAAHRDEELARAKVRARLLNDPQYRAALEAKRQASASFEPLRNLDVTSSERISALTRRTELSAVVTRMEGEAYRGDPELQQALERVTRGGQQSRNDQREFKSSITSDPTWIAALSRLQQARRNLDRSYSVGSATQSGRGRPSSRRGYSSR